MDPNKMALVQALLAQQGGGAPPQQDMGQMPQQPMMQPGGLYNPGMDQQMMQPPMPQQMPPQMPMQQMPKPY